MKNIWKLTLLSALVLGSGMLAGCREEEELNLAGYPQVPVGVAVADAENAAAVTVKGSYEAGTGALVLDGTLNRTYTVALATPSPKDATLRVEAFSKNIPEDRIAISETELFIPAGAISASVTVSLVDDDMTFMAEEEGAQTYELGLRLVDIEGSKLEMGQTEAKVVVEKEAYVATASVVGVDGGTTASFKRGYIDGEFASEDPISYEYKVVLDKPALRDLTFAGLSSGVPEENADDERFTPQTVTVRAGELESDPIAWTITDDFLGANNDPASFEILLTMVPEGEDASVVMSEQTGCTITVTKVFDRMTFVDAVDPSWTEFDTTGWTIDPASIGNVLFDNNTNTYIVDRTFVIDMQSEKSIAGFKMTAVYNYNGYLPTLFKISVSDDGESWVSWGEMNRYTAPTSTALYIALVKSSSARYIKFEALQVTWYYFAEFDIYGKN
ncbi:DUF4989 domain-containing protein [uncultured Alistipes sp.]|uniref:DUF4989 domain-containing protein n=1 Tax=uncultured Alistipes sp. TaxID=538949 RepID=UPI00263309B2|nr:DUF4989 domain-containing protein [uncultured Alistipes sp.]